MGNMTTKVLGTVFVGTAIILGLVLAVGVPLNIVNMFR